LKWKLNKPIYITCLRYYLVLLHKFIITNSIHVFLWLVGKISRSKVLNYVIPPNRVLKRSDVHVHKEYKLNKEEFCKTYSTNFSSSWNSWYPLNWIKVRCDIRQLGTIGCVAKIGKGSCSCQQETLCMKRLP